MNTLLSGTLGAVSFTNNRNAEVHWYDGRVEILPLPTVYRIFSRVEDSIELSSSSKNEALSRLDLEYKKERGLLYFASLFDEDSTFEENKVLQETLNEYMKDPEVFNYIKSVMASNHLPKLSGQYVNDNILKSGPSGNLFNFLLDNRKRISLIRETWTSASRLIEDEKAIQMETTLVSLGVFAKLICGSKQEISSLYMQCLSKLKNIIGYREVLQPFFSDFIRSANETEKQTQPLFEDYTSDQGLETFKTPISNEKIIENVQNRIQLAKTHFENQDYEEGKSVVLDLIRDQCEREEYTYAAKTLCNVANHLSTLSQFTLQRDFAEKAYNLCPEDPHCLYQLADAHYNLKQFEKAENLFFQTRDIDREYGLLGLLRVYNALEAYEKVADIGEQLLELGPEDIRSWTVTAKAYRHLEKYDRAIEIYKNGIEKRVESTLYCGLASALVDKKQYNDAIKEYQNCINIYPETAVPYTALGHLYARLGQFDKAFPLLSEGIMLSKKGKEAKAIWAFISAYKMEGKYYKRIREILKLNNNLKDHHLFICAEILQCIDKSVYKQAEDKLDIAYKKFGETLELQILDAKLKYLRGDISGFNSLCDKLIFNNGNNAEVRVLKLSYLRKFGRCEEINNELNSMPENLIQEDEIIREILLSGLDKFLPKNIKLESRAQHYETATIEDWEFDHAYGVNQVVKDQAIKVKEMLQKGKRLSPTKSLKKKYKLVLSIVKSRIGQTGSVANTIKGYNGYIAYVVRGLAYWKLGSTDKLKICISYLKRWQSVSVVNDFLNLVQDESYEENLHRERAKEFGNEVLLFAA